MGRPQGRVRFFALTVSFVVLCVAGAAWAMSQADVAPSQLMELGSLPGSTLLLAGLMAAGIYVAEALRYRSFGKAFETTLSWRASFDAGVADFFFSALTPGATMGAPAAIWMLTRRGVPLDAAMLIAFAKTVTSMIFILLAAFVVMVVGLGPELSPWIVATMLTSFGLMGLCVGLLVVGAFSPDRVRPRIHALSRWLSARALLQRLRLTVPLERGAGALQTTLDRLALLRRAPWPVQLEIVAAHALYYTCYAGLAVVLAMSFGASDIGRAAGTSVVYLAVLMVIPTPGASGVSEAIGPAFFEPLVSAHAAVLVVLGYRALSLYGHVVFGAAYLAVVGGLYEIVSRDGDER